MVLFFHNMLQLVLLVVIPNPINLLQIYNNNNNNKKKLINQESLPFFLLIKNINK